MKKGKSPEKIEKIEKMNTLDDLDLSFSLWKKLVAKCVSNSDFLELKKLLLSKLLPENVSQEVGLGRFKFVVQGILELIDPGKTMEMSVGVCGKRLTLNGTFFFCRTCEKDPTSCVCQQCFQEGDHKGHNYVMVSGGSGVCDCGDEDSWDPKGFCKSHQGSETDPLQQLSSDVVAVGGILCDCIIQVISEWLFNKEKKEVVIKKLGKEKKPVVKRSESPEIIRFRTSLRYLQAIPVHQREHNHDQLVQLLTGIIARHESALTPIKEKEEKKKEEEVKEETIKRLVEPDISPFLNYVAQLVAQTPCFKRLMYLSFSKTDIFDKLIKGQTSFNAPNRQGIMKFYHACVADSKFKKSIAALFIKNYKNYFVVMNQGFTDGIFKKSYLADISVQFLSAGKIVNKLCDENDLINVFFDTFLEVLKATVRDVEGRKVVDIVKDRTSTLFHNILADLRYVFRQKEVCKAVLKNKKLFQKFVDILTYYQFCSVTKKIDSDEVEWKKSFIREFYYFPKILRMLIRNGFKDMTKKEILHEFKNNLKYLVAKIGKCSGEISPCFEKKMNVEGPVFFHFMLHKFLGLLVHRILYLHNDIDLLSYLDFMKSSETCAKDILLFPMRAIGTCFHVMRKFWPRNNMGIGSQAMNYILAERHKDYCKLLDYFLIQVFSKFLPREDVLQMLLNQFKVKPEIFSLAESEEKELDIEYDFLNMLLSLFFDRGFSGNSHELTTEDYVIHGLTLGNLEYSKVRGNVPRLFRKGCDVEKILKDVSVFQKNTSFGIGRSTYRLKDEHWNKFNPWHLGYDIRYENQAITKYLSNPKYKEDPYLLFLKDWRSKVEKNGFKEKFATMQGFENLFQSELIHKILYINLFRVLKKSDEKKIFSDNILRATLCIIMVLLVQHRVQVVDKKEKSKAKEEEEKKLDDIKIQSFKDVDFSKCNEFIKNFTRRFSVDGEKSSILSMILELDFRKISVPFVTEVLDLLDGIDNEEISELVDESKKKRKKEDDLKRRKERAKRKREKILRKMNKDKISFDKLVEDEMDAEEDVDGVSKEQKGEKEEGDGDVCVFCHSGDKKAPLSQMVYVSKSNSLEIVESKSAKDLGYSTFKNFWKVLIPTQSSLPDYYNLFVNMNFRSGIQLNSCTHHCHSSCFHDYWKSLLSKTNFNGRHLVNLADTEILCPVCSRIENTLLPRIPTKSLEKKEKSSFLGNIGNFEDTIGVKMFGVPGDERQNYFLSVNTLAYNLGIEEVCLRTDKQKIDLNLPKMRMQMLKDFMELMLYSISENPKHATFVLEKFGILKRCFQGEVIDSSNLKFLGMKSAYRKKRFHKIFSSKEEEKSKEVESKFFDSGVKEKVVQGSASQMVDDPVDFIPFLSNDMFSFFVRYFLADTKNVFFLRKGKCVDFCSMFPDLSSFAIASIVQLLTTLSLKFIVKSDGKEDEFISGLYDIVSSYGKDFSSSKIKKEQKVITNITEFVKNSFVTFLRRVSIFYSVVFGKELAEYESKNEYDALLKGLGLCLTKKELKSSEKMVQKWLIQFFSNLKVFKEDECVNYFVPSPSSSKKFEFTALPKTYETLYLQCKAKRKCKECGKDQLVPAIDLISGKLVHAKGCTCKGLLALSLGYLTKLVWKRYAGNGVFLFVNMSTLFVKNQRRTIKLTSPYRDKYDQVDIGHKRGQPLFLCSDFIDHLIPMFLRNSWGQDSKTLNTTSNYKPESW